MAATAGRWACLALLAAGAARADLAAREVVRVDLAGGGPVATLQAFADQTGWQVAYDPRDLEGLRLPAVRGEMTVRQAAGQLVRGTTLWVEFEEFTQRVYLCPAPDVLPRRREVVYRDAPLRPEDTPRGPYVPVRRR